MIRKGLVNLSGEYVQDEKSYGKKATGAGGQQRRQESREKRSQLEANNDAAVLTRRSLGESWRWQDGNGNGDVDGDGRAACTSLSAVRSSSSREDFLWSLEKHEA